MSVRRKKTVPKRRKNTRTLNIHRAGVFVLGVMLVVISVAVYLDAPVGLDFRLLAPAMGFLALYGSLFMSDETLEKLFGGL